MHQALAKNTTSIRGKIEFVSFTSLVMASNKVPIATKQPSCYKVAQCSTNPTNFLKIWIEPIEFYAYLALTWHASIVPFCCHPKCKMSLRSSKKADLEIIFHQFPNKDDRKLQWLPNIEMTPNEFRLYWNLCCLHFKKKAIMIETTNLSQPVHRVQ